MSFPDDPLDLVVEIAPGANPADDPMTYEWLDITDRLRQSAPITISRGKSSPLADTVPSSCSLSLDNSDGRFTPRNPIGPYYPDLARNTPLRVRLRHAYATFGLPATNGWDTADSGQAWTVTGTASDYSVVSGGTARMALTTENVLRIAHLDVGVATHRVRASVVIPVVPTGSGISVRVAGRMTDTSNYYEAQILIGTSGAATLQIFRRVAGAGASVASGVSVGTHSAGNGWHVLFDCAGSTLRAKAWKTTDTEPAGWQVAGTDTSLATGSRVGCLARRESGNTNGTVNVDWDNVDVSTDRFTGYVDAWPPRWDPSGALKWVPIQAFGTLKRISSAGEATRSALYRYITENGFHLSAYWPLEDGPLATDAASAVTGVEALTLSLPVRFGQASPAGGVGTLVDTSGAYMQGRITVEYATDWRVECVIAHDAVPTTTVRVLSWLCRGTISRWDLNTTAAGIQLVGLTAVTGGSTVVTIATGFLPQPGRLHHLRVDVTLSGSTNTAQVYADGTLVGSATYSPSLTLQPNVLRVNPDAASTDMPAVGHVAIWSATPLPATASAAAALGSPGEQAHARIAAVCAERSVPYEAYGTAVTSELMGPRPSASLVSQLREAEATDGGILYELTSGHLSYRPRSTLYNQAVGLALDYTERHIAPPFEPSDDDAQLRNDVTARRPSGSEARYVDEAHAAAVGRYETSISANPSDDAQLEQMAAWAVHRGTAEEQRFDTIALRMTAGDPVVSGWLGSDIGSRITVANVPSDLTPDDVDVILAGYTETYGEHPVWSVQALCEPASSWTIGELDDLVLGRLDTAGSQVTTGDWSAPALVASSADFFEISNADAVGFAVGQDVVIHDPAGRRKRPTVHEIVNTTSAFGFTRLYLSPAPEDPVSGSLSATGDRISRVDSTTLTVATTTGPPWTTNAAHLPFDINIGGERLTVTAVSGASSPQTFTVVRSVNGVRKAAQIGTVVRLWQPLILGL